MKQSEILELSLPELREKLDQEKGQYLKLRINHSVSPIENPMKLKSVRRTIARLETELTKRLVEKK